MFKVFLIANPKLNRKMPLELSLKLSRMGLSVRLDGWPMAIQVMIFG